MFTKNANLLVTRQIAGVGNCANQGLVAYDGNTFTAGEDVTSPSNTNYISYLMKTVKKSTITYSSSSDIYGVWFGTGNDAPTADDYTFSGEMVTGFTSSYVHTVSYNADGSTSITTVYTITAPTSGDITIGEVCMFSNPYGKTPAYTSSYRYHPVLIERTALDNPITIPAGGVGQVTYTVTIPSLYA